MGIFSKKEVPVTGTQYAEDSAKPGHDLEKPQVDHNEAYTTTARHSDAHLEAERRLIRKMDKRVPLLLSALYLVAFLDRSNIGNARIAGMEKDLKLHGDEYDWFLTIFYISYIFGQVQGLLWKVLPPHRWAFIVVFAWGTIAACQAAVRSWSAEMALRFLLGIFEAGYGPGVPYLLSFFYLRHEIGLRVGMFISAAPLANTFAGALAYGITSGHSKLANWRLLFLVEGIPTLLLAPVAFFFLPDSPVHARFLSEEEKLIAKARGVRQVGEVERVGSLDWKDVGATLMDLKAWVTALMYFSCNVSFASLPVFLPTILDEMGFTSIDAQGLSAPPYFVSFLITIGSTFVADRIQQRGLVIFVLSLAGMVGYILLASCYSVGPKYFGVFLAAGGVFPAIANILPWVLNNQGSDTRRGMGIVILNVIGQCGPILGTRIFPERQGPQYVKGQAICAAFMGFNAFLAMSLRLLLVWENRKLDAKYGKKELPTKTGEKTGEDGASAVQVAGEENYGSSFRYTL